MVLAFEDHRHHLAGYHFVHRFRRRRPRSLAEDRLLMSDKWEVKVGECVGGRKEYTLYLKSVDYLIWENTG
jgi:hypothetical protein